MYPSLPSSLSKYLVSTKFTVYEGIVVDVPFASFFLIQVLGKYKVKHFSEGFSGVQFLWWRVLLQLAGVLFLSLNSNLLRSSRRRWYWDFSLFPASRSKLNSNVEELNLTFNEADMLLNFERVLEKADAPTARFVLNWGRSSGETGLIQPKQLVQLLNDGEMSEWWFTSR